jgi:hypothetical protein
MDGDATHANSVDSAPSHQPCMAPQDQSTDGSDADKVSVFDPDLSEVQLVGGTGVHVVTHEVEQPVTARLVTEWIPLAQEEVLCVVSVTEDSVVLSIPSYSEQAGVLSYASRLRARSHAATSSCPVSFITVQRMHMVDGCKFVSVCSNPGCDREDGEGQLFRREAKEPYRGERYTAVFADANPMCRCARAAIVTLFGVDGGDNLECKDALASFEEWFDTEQMWSTFQLRFPIRSMPQPFTICLAECAHGCSIDELIVMLLAGKDGDSISVQGKQYTFSRVQDDHIGHQGWGVLEHTPSGRACFKCHSCTSTSQHSLMVQCNINKSHVAQKL